LATVKKNVGRKKKERQRKIVTTQSIQLMSVIAHQLIISPLGWSKQNRQQKNVGHFRLKNGLQLVQVSSFCDKTVSVLEEN